MPTVTWDDLGSLVRVILIISLVAGALAALMLAWIYRDVRRLRIPAEAGFFGTLRVIPLRVAIFLDLLDLALDSFAAPVAWAVLRWLRLDNLRAPAVIEAFIPFTQFIPTMTVLWVATRAFNLGELPAPLRDDILEGRVVRRGARPDAPRLPQRR